MGRWCGSGCTDDPARLARGLSVACLWREPKKCIKIPVLYVCRGTEYSFHGPLTRVSSHGNFSFLSPPCVRTHRFCGHYSRDWRSCRPSNVAAAAGGYVRRALDAGLNLIDTAPGYEAGYSEQIVGQALQGYRDRVFVIDKIDSLDQPVAPQIEASLKRLQMDYTDLFVFHNVSTLEAWSHITAPGGGMEQLQQAIGAGKTRFKGISRHRPAVLAAAIPSGLVDVVMFPVGPYVDRRYKDEILPLARQYRVGTVCFKTFGAGKLLDDTSGYNQPLQEWPPGMRRTGERSRACRTCQWRNACSTRSPAIPTWHSWG